MRMSHFLASTVLATVIGSSAAFALPFTWNPSLTANGTLSTGAAAFTANNITINDFALIDATNQADVIEHAYLSVQVFDVATPGLVNAGGTAQSGVGTPYKLYFDVTTHSNLSGPPNNLQGVFTQVTYTLFGDIGGACTFSAAFSGVAKSCGGDVQLNLASGVLSPNGLNQVLIVGGIPFANVDVTVTLGPDAGGFWVAPLPLLSLNFETSFSNTPGEATTGTGANAGKFLIGGCPNQTCPGSGTFDLVGVPEPVTLSLFGAGLAGAAALRRRKAKKA